MNIIYSILFIFLFNPIYLFGQVIKGKTYSKFISADSVAIVSHIATYTPIASDSNYNKITRYELVENDKPNYEIITEYSKLNVRDIETLAKIILTKNNDRTIDDISCFIPHHGILIFKNGKCSFFDICFGCRHFVTSKDITLSDELSRRTWLQLASFFKKRGFKYELEGPQ